MVVVDKENFMGGTGIAHFEHIMMADEMHGMNRVYAKVTLKKGCSRTRYNFKRICICQRKQ